MVMLPKQCASFAQYLLEQNLLDQPTVTKLIATAQQHNLTFITTLLQNNLLASNVMAKLIAHYFNLPYQDLQQTNLEELPLAIFPKELIYKYQILPLVSDEDQISLAISDPTDTTACNAIKFHFGLNPQLIIVDYQQLKAILKQLSQNQPSQITTIEDTPIIHLVDNTLNLAITRNASDLHFEPYASYYRIRFRIDGELVEINKIDLTLAARFSTRLKILANLNIAEKRLPQDGRFSFKATDNNTHDCRINSCPTLFGEKIVIRILNRHNLQLDITQLGFAEKQQQLFYKYITAPQGMILVTGPTGSGKTITLYSALNYINQPNKNIATIEDPIEIDLPGINQLEVKQKIGLDFAAALRAFLRQDPDIIMVGEIRDTETAQIAINAAQTGHLVFSTLHTNNAAATLVRLNNMKIAAFNLGAALKLIIAQRLVRKLCVHCKIPKKIPLGIPTNAGKYETYSAVGCSHCNQGYSGRTAIFEILEITPTISEMILQNQNHLAIENYAKQNGMVTLRESALAKVYAGITSVEEIDRVIMID